MTRSMGPFLLGVLIGTIGLAGAFVATSAFAGPPRAAHRRMFVPAYLGVYVAPRYVYPGYVAPWGSLPPGFYAASIPLPFQVVQPTGYLDPLAEPAGPVGRVPQQAFDEASRPSVPNGQPESLGPVAPPLPDSGPETIPTPRPVDAPGADDFGRPRDERAAKGAAAETDRSPQGAASPGTPGDGPREF